MPGTYDDHNPLLTSSETLLGSLEAAREIGVDLTGPLLANGIRSELLVSPKGYLTFHQVVNFLNDVANEFHCPHFGFLVGKHQPPLRFGVMAQLPRFSSTLGEAIENATRYSLLNSEVSLWELKCEGGYASLVRHNRVSYKDSLVQLHSLAVTSIFKALKSMGGENWRASSICFTHKKLETGRLYNSFFGAPVAFNQDFNGVVFPEKYLHQAIPSADSELLAIVKSYLDSVSTDYQLRDDVPTKVHYHIKQTLGTKLCDLSSIAQLLNQHPRTLQRELLKHGVTFRELLAQVRQDIAEHYLRSSSIPLADMADILGYRNVSAFSRAFKNSCGTSPEQWKQRHALHH